MSVRIYILDLFCTLLLLCTIQLSHARTFRILTGVNEKMKNYLKRIRIFPSTYHAMQVETCQEKIISLELQDPENDDNDSDDGGKDKICNPFASLQHAASAYKGPATILAVATQTNATVADETLDDEEPPELLRETALLDTVDEDDDEEDEEDEEEDEHDAEDSDEEEDDEDEEDAASIVTVHANNEKLFLRTDDDSGPSDDFDSIGIFGPSSIDSVSSISKLRIQPVPITIHQTLAKEVVVTEPVVPAGVHTTTKSGYPAHSMTAASTIVEVVNPLITGEGQVKSLAVGSTTQCEYPIFDNETEKRLRSKPYDDDIGDIARRKGGYGDEADDEPDDNYDGEAEKFSAAATGVLRSDTFVMPTVVQQQQQRPQEELSLNAKMKNVLVELLENERVKLNLQKSLEDDEKEQHELAYGDPDDEDDLVDYAALHGANLTGISRSAGRAVSDDNGNERLLQALMRDSNRNTIKKLAVGYDDEESEEEDDEDDGDEEDEEEESLDSSDSEEDGEAEDEEEAVNITFVDGCQVIENPNAESTLKLQKSQTYTSMKDADQTEDKQSGAAQDDVDKDIEHTVEKLQAEQRKLEEITKQLRKSVENLLADDKEVAAAISQTIKDDDDVVIKNPKQNVVHTVETKTVIGDDGGKKTIITETIRKPESKQTYHEPEDEKSGEALFNKLLHGGGDLKQIFDQQTGESVITTTTTDADGTVTTTTTTISNVIKSGIPRAVVLKSEASLARTNNSNGNSGSSQSANTKQEKQHSKQKRKGKNGKK